MTTSQGEGGWAEQNLNSNVHIKLKTEHRAQTPIGCTLFPISNITLQTKSYCSRMFRRKVGAKNATWCLKNYIYVQMIYFPPLRLRSLSTSNYFLSFHPNEANLCFLNIKTLQLNVVIFASRKISFLGQSQVA